MAVGLTNGFEVDNSSCPALASWIRTVTQHMPHLSKAQATVLALLSFGIAMTQACGQSTLTVFLAKLLGKKEDAVRQRLREWYWEANAKQGTKRQELNVTLSFAPLVLWVLSLWPQTPKRLALAMDATTLKDIFTVLSISIVYRGCAIPVAWAILPGNCPGVWKPHWLRLFECLDQTLSPDWFVIVMADRGLYAKWLYQAILRLGWHPFLRINMIGTYRREGESDFRPLPFAAPKIGTHWSGRVTCFRKRRLQCTLLARWDEGHSEPWLIVTDLPPEHADVCWYAMRAWIEAGFKDLKRGGCRWNYTRMTDPKRAERYWLALAVATLWLVAIGGEADATLPASSFDELPERHIARQTKKPNRLRPRALSCFRRGALVLLANLMARVMFSLGSFHPESWPASEASPSSG